MNFVDHEWILILKYKVETKHSLRWILRQY